MLLLFIDLYAIICTESLFCPVFKNRVYHSLIMQTIAQNITHWFWIPRERAQKTPYSYSGRVFVKKIMKISKFTWVKNKKIYHVDIMSTW